MPTLRQWRNKGMLLERGKLIAYGSLEDVVVRYKRERTIMAASIRSQVGAHPG
jgi:ABC-type polysaccharide/polyol phosphate transport system ATPase subunit